MDRAEEVAVVVVVDPPRTKVALHVGWHFFAILHHLKKYFKPDCLSTSLI